MKKFFSIFSLSLLIFTVISFKFAGGFPPILPNNNKAFNKPISTADITIDAFTSDDSSKVVKYVAYLKDANNNIIQTAYSDSNRVTFKNVPTPVENEKNTTPLDFRFYQNYPNPFNPETAIRYELAKGSDVKLDIYDITGKLVKTLENKFENAGTHEVKWDGYNSSGERIAQGIYIYRIMTDQGAVAKKMVYLHGAHPKDAAGSSSFPALSKTSSNSPQSSEASNQFYVKFASNPDSTRPLFQDFTMPVEITKDTILNVYTQRYLRPPALEQITDKNFNEDEGPSNGTIVDSISAVGYDSLGNEGTVAYLLEQSRPDLINFVLQGNKIVFDSLAKDANGQSALIYKAIGQNGGETDKSFAVTVNPMTDLNVYVDSLFGNGGPIPGVLVSYAGKSGTSDNNGYVHLQVAPSSSIDTLVMDKNGFHERRTSPFASSSGDKTVNETMVDTSLHTDFVNETSRHVTGAFNRWVKQPVYYINTNPAHNSNGTTTPVTQSMIDTAVSIIQNDIPEFTNGFINNPSIIIGTNPPDYGTLDTIRVEWDNRIPGLGAHGEYTNNYGFGDTIISAYSKFRIGAGRATYLQELLQTLGPRDDSNRQKTSIFNSPAPVNYMTPLDVKLGKFIYSRKPGNRPPDADK